MNINDFEGTIGYFVISRLAGGEVLESYTKNPQDLQNLLEISINYIETFNSLKNYLVNYSEQEKLRILTLDHVNTKVFIVELKEEDIYVVTFFNFSYPEGLLNLFLKNYLENVRQNYASL